MTRRTVEDETDNCRTRHIDTLLGQRVRRLREDAGFTQVQIAQALGISSNQWSRHESGENRIPAARLWQFCRIIGSDVASLFAGLPHSVGPVASSMGVAEEASSFATCDDEAGQETRTIAATARILPSSTRRLLLTIARAMRDEAKKSLHQA